MYDLRGSVPQQGGAEKIESCDYINQIENQDTESPTRGLWSGLVGDVPVGSSTSVANGLSQQLIYQMNLIEPDTLVSCEDLNVHLRPAAYPLVQAAAKEGLKRAISDRGVALTLNSGYRTIVQQQILYNHRRSNPNPVAIPGQSDHQSGVAIDVDRAREWDRFMIRHGWQPLPNDPPHFDFSPKRDIRALSVLAFQQLWNKNHPSDRIAEDGDYRVGGETATRLNKSPVMGFKIAPWADQPRTLKLRTPYSAGHDVTQLQKALVAKGVDTDIDGIFGPGTEKAVKAFQAREGLSVDGAVRAETRAQLELSGPSAANSSTSAPVPPSTGSTPAPEDTPQRGSSDNDSPIDKPKQNGRKPLVLKQGMVGIPIVALQRKLKALNILNRDSKIDGDFGPGTKAALVAFQKQMDLTPDGEAGPQTIQALGISPEVIKHSLDTMLFSAERVSQIFHDAPRRNVETYLPLVLSSLEKLELGDRDMILMALATIRAESAGFEPISEFQSEYNTDPGGRPFGKYDFRPELGNNGVGEGDRFKGRGFVQLTGRANYTQFSQALGLGTQLVDNPDLANDPSIAADLLAHFLKAKEDRIRVALYLSDLITARKAVNGGTHGMDRFEAAYNQGQALINGSSTGSSTNASVTDAPVLKLQSPPMTGNVVRRLQAALLLAGFSTEVNGVFDAATDQAVRGFQARAGLEVDGAVGPKTLARLQQTRVQISTEEKDHA